MKKFQNGVVNLTVAIAAITFSSTGANACTLDQARATIINYVKARYSKENKIYMGSVQAVYDSGIVDHYEAKFATADKTGEFKDEPGMIGKIVVDLLRCMPKTVAESCARLD